MDTQKLTTLIKSNLNCTEVIIHSEDNVHFDAIVISPLFEGVTSKVKQQQLVYQILNDYIRSGEIHALSLKTFTPTQWQTQQNG